MVGGYTRLWIVLKEITSRKFRLARLDTAEQRLAKIDHRSQTHCTQNAKV